MGFADEVRAEVKEALQDVTTVFRYSVQDLVAEVKKEGPSKGPPPAPGRGGSMPVQLGNLRRSLRSSTSAMPQINPNLSEGISDGQAEIILTIAGAELGETVFLGFTAAYAQRLNYGFTGQDALGRTYDQSGYHFVENAAARWEQIVAENDAKVRGFRS